MVDVVQGVGPRGAVAQSRTRGGDVDDAVGVGGQGDAAVGRLVAADVGPAVLETGVAREVGGREGDGGVGAAVVYEHRALLKDPIAAACIVGSRSIGGLHEARAGGVACIGGAEQQALTRSAVVVGQIVLEGTIMEVYTIAVNLLHGSLTVAGAVAPEEGVVDVAGMNAVDIVIVNGEVVHHIAVVHVAGT